ncbi:hypothetical protein BpOF4_18560 [Alkalihalophilus pseudofirmus OF4]|uniref:Uncharacterized protein n=1 Tax=Alkalihalophilus pseudofirmus (strain ATCC BAA-2126 / JCM 17055 / OF4) TaxID=398511 RepID=D3FSB8_ALKPO|nr:hypothetical protein [Alkalihalophilus pseudofirmus]ADC51753.1 hypothetical protein BpOF4_18560 [Alkalihalophilus pseudofirmus OF4]OLS36970.1 hypothetical protein BTR22_09745 [Alkalihalophilus pseudofirmus]
MEEKKPRLSLTGAIVLLSITILFSSCNISSAIRDTQPNYTGNDTYYYELDYELNRFNENFEELIKTLQENNE